MKFSIFLLVFYFALVWSDGKKKSVQQPDVSNESEDQDAEDALFMADIPNEQALTALDTFDSKRYNNTDFHYQNHQDQWVLPRPKGLIFKHNCLRQYFKCLMSTSGAGEPVCAYNHPYPELLGFRSSPSSCDIYFDNCRRGYNLFSLIKDFGDHALKEGGISTVLFGPIPIYVIADPVQATVILSTCLEKSFVYKLVDPLFGDLLVSAKGSVWKRNRKILNLAFKTQVLEGYMGVFNSQASKLLEIIDKKADKGFVDITSDVTRNIVETAFQTTMGPLPDNQDFVENYVKAYHTVFEILTMRVQKAWMFFDFLFNFSKHKRVFDEALKIISEQSTKMVELGKTKYFFRIQDKKMCEHNNHAWRNDVTSLLDFLIENSMTTEGSLFTDAQLSYLCDNVLLAAFDTTTYELLFTLVCIGSDEDVQRKIYQEIQDVLGEETIVKKEHLHKLVYLEAAIKEAIRLYPIAPMVSRQATEKVTMGNVTLPAGSVFAVHLWAINRSEKLWGPDAAEFNPGRWLNRSTLPDHPNAFSSFSFGRRNCIGKLYAMMLMKTTLVSLLRKYIITADHKMMEFDCFIMLKPRAGHLMKFELR